MPAADYRWHWRNTLNGIADKLEIEADRLISRALGVDVLYDAERELEYLLPEDIRKIKRLASA